MANKTIVGRITKIAISDFTDKQTGEVKKRFSLEVDAGNKYPFKIGGFTAVPEVVEEARKEGYPAEITYYDKEQYHNYVSLKKAEGLPQTLKPAREIKYPTNGEKKEESPLFKSADQVTERDSNIMSARHLVQDAKEVFKAEFDFLPGKDDGSGPWATLNSIIIYLQKNGR